MSSDGDNSTLIGRLRERIPLGLFHSRKPRHFRAMLETLRDNAGQWHEMWQVLNGPCNGCAVQTDGLRDNVLPRSPHFCLVRLGLIEEALRRPFDPGQFRDVARLRRFGNELIEALGRIPVPLLRRRGELGFVPIDFNTAYDLAARWIGERRGETCGFFTTSKGVCNEEYFAFQQFARIVGFTHNVDSCARQCHAASVTALKSAIGIGASTGSLADFVHADLLVLAGTNLANNQPLVMRYIAEGRQSRGGRPRVIVVNAYREPGLDRYWVPSSPRSALFGTKIADRFVRVRVGGDVAFFNGVLKVLIDERLLTERHRQFINAQTAGFDDVCGTLGQQSLDDLEARSSVPRNIMAEVARELAATENILFVWGMGLTQHKYGTDNVKSVVNLALALGQLGRPHSGLAALRGQSSVQAAGECGVAPNIFPGGEAVNDETCERFEAAWGAPLPRAPGLATGPMIEAVHDGRISCLVSLGGNLVDTMPGREFVREALRRLPYRIRFDVMMNREALIEPGDATLILPVRNWYEWDSVFTTTSTDRTIRAFRGTIRPRSRDVPESWQALRDIASRVRSDRDARTRPGQCPLSYASTDAIRAAMERDIWMYHGITQLDAPHRQMQWGGPTLFTNGFDRLPGGRARFSPLVPSNDPIPPGYFQVSTRRGWGQWNSQHRRRRPRRDAFTGARSLRDVLIHPDDARQLSLADGQPVRLESPAGARLEGICRVDEAQLPRHVQIFWPAANDLIPPRIYDAPSHEPDFNVIARIVPLSASEQAER